MAWVAGAVAGGVSLIGGMMGSNDARSEGKKSRALMKEQLDFAKSQYADYKEMYGGIEASLIEEVGSYVPGEKLQQFMGEASTDVAMAYGKREGMRTRSLGRLGIDPSQERFQEDVDEVGRERALSEIGARTGARRKSEAEDDKQFARKLATLSTGKEIPGQSGAVMGALQSGAMMHQQSAAQYGEGAAAGFGAAGQWAAKSINDYNSQPDTGVGGMSGPTSGVDYAVPQSNVYGGAGYGDTTTDYD